MENIYFVSFANSKYYKSLDKLRDKVNQISFITNSYFFREKDIDKKFKKSLNTKIYRRGYGYWRWKPYFCKRIFDRLNENDIMIYSDAGNCIDISNLERLKYYIDCCKKSSSGILAFQNAEKGIERDYNKMDCVNFFNIDDESILNNYQLWAGFFLLKKCHLTSKIINEWVELAINNKDLFTDRRSLSTNFDSFIEHRHDQSVFSLLVKLNETRFFPPEEFAKQNYSRTPIKPLRQRNNSSKDKILRRIEIPISYIIGLYLVYMKHFFFLKKIWW